MAHMLDMLILKVIVYRLVAIMLGRLKMDIESRIDVYCKFSETIFKHKLGLINFTLGVEQVSWKSDVRCSSPGSGGEEAGCFESAR